MSSVARRPRVRALALALAVLTLSVGLASVAPASVAEGSGAGTTVVLQPCVAGGGWCETAPVTTTDGRIFVQLFPVFVGAADVYLKDVREHREFSYRCESPPATDCSKLIAVKPGTYIISIAFTPTTQGALLVEALTPS